MGRVWLGATSTNAVKNRSDGGVGRVETRVSRRTLWRVLVGAPVMEMDGPVNTQTINGIEAMQLRAVADSVIGVHPEAVVSMTLVESVMHVRVDHPGGNPAPRWLTIDTDATGLPVPSETIPAPEGATEDWMCGGG